MDDSALVVALKWFSTAASTIAAPIVALDLGRRRTGSGSVSFVISGVGIYTYLIRKKADG